MSGNNVSEVEVLVVGAGPAGVMCALALSKAGVHVRIVDSLPGRLVPGRADALHRRTLEILESYGIAQQAISLSHRLYYSTSYVADSDGNIARSKQKQSLLTGGRYPFGAALSQGTIEGIFRDAMQSFGTKSPEHGESAYEYNSPWQPKSVQVEQGTTPILMDLESLDSSGSIAIRLQRRDGTTEDVRAKYVIGCDGAHSWVRSQLGFPMEGDQSNAVWGVVDAVPNTDFPDIRNHTWITTKERRCMILPRENGLIRLYVQLFEAELTSGRYDRSQVMLDHIEEVATKAFKPYHLSFQRPPEWWTVYVVGQRLASSYSAKGRIFLAGDACHTHSPHAGQGMNVAMGDSHNLAWRLVHVLRGWAKPQLLESYESERRKFAEDLIEFDRNLASILKSKSATAHNEHQKYREAFGGFISGIGIQYTSPDFKVVGFQDLAKGAIIGRRLAPLVVLRMVDCRPFNIHDLLPADTRYKLLVFCQNRREDKAKLEELATALPEITPTRQLHDYFDVVYIEKLEKQHVNMLNVPNRLVRHWSQAFIDDVALSMEDGGGTAFENYGISTDGCIILVRPDGYVGTVSPLGGNEFLKHLGFYTENVCKFAGIQTQSW